MSFNPQFFTTSKGQIMARREPREKQPARGTRRQQRQQLHEEVLAQQAANSDQYAAPVVRQRVPLAAKTEAQGHYMISMKSKQLTLGVGPAGTGKTYVCTTYAAQLLADKDVQKIIVTRPAIEAGGGLGFLPGTIEEKFAPYFAPFQQVLQEFFGKTHLEYLLKRGVIEIAPLEYIRGLTFDNAFVILDEAQNTTPTQMKLFLTRLGEYSRVVINGDTDQKDIKGLSGLEDACQRLRGLSAVGICEFTEDDVVRSGLVKDILQRYRKS